MRYDWLIDVLADLKAFADAQGLGATADAIDDASLVALAEISSRTRADQVRSEAGEHVSQVGNVTFLFEKRRHA